MANAPRVLVVEDDEDTRANLRDILEMEGFQVEAVSSGQEALELDRFHEFTAIVLDRRLPDTTADALLPQIKSLAPDAEVVIVTGHADLEGTISALRNGAADYLLKPIDANLLRATLARLTRLKDAERRARDAERLASIGEMAAVLAHEGRGSLHQMALNSALLTVQAKDQPSLLETIYAMEKAQHSLARLFDDLTCYASSLAMESQSLDLREVWRNIWSKLPQHGTQSAELLEEGDGTEPRVWGDRFRLEQVFRNLFENSLAACPSPAHIAVRWSEYTHRGRPAQRLSLSDNGPGLTTQQRQRAFEPFYSTKSSGTGLGLPIVKRIVEIHGGQIGIGDRESGAEFVIILPLENCPLTSASVLTSARI